MDCLEESLTDSGKVSKASVAARLKQATDAEEIDALKQMKDLIEKEAVSKKLVKVAQEALDLQVLQQYAQLTEADNKMLIVEDKWLATLQANIIAEIERVTQQLANRVKTLEERYEEPLPELNKQVELLSANVDKHLGADGVGVVSWGEVKEASAEYRVSRHSREQDELQSERGDSVGVEDCPAGYKKTGVGIIPEEWRVGPLISICSMKSGESITSTNIDDSSTYPCYGGNGLRGYTSRSTHSGEYALIGRQGALCGNVISVRGEFFASEHAIVVTPSKRTNIGWLAYVLRRMNLNQFSESSAQPGLSVSKLLVFPLAAPNFEEQTAIANALSDVDALITSLEKLIAKKRAIKTAAMQQLLTGKKTPATV